jgi:cytosine deaminase
LPPLIAESGVNAIANPLIDITLKGRHDTYPRWRGLTRVAEMRALDVAHMAVHAAPMTSREAIR